MTSALIETEHLPAPQAAADRIIFFPSPATKNLPRALRTSGAKPTRPNRAVNHSHHGLHPDNQRQRREPEYRPVERADMPQDEILAQLLLNTRTAKLSPFQLAEIAAASASRLGIYRGAKQSATDGGTQATVQIDLTKGLKLETAAGSGNLTDGA